MAKQTTKSSVLKKLGSKGMKIFEAHKNDEVKLDTGGNLPSGIEQGIAQLVECKFGEYQSGPNKGEPFCYMAGVVKLPKDLDGLPLVGLRTQFGPEPLCETKNADGSKTTTLEDHMQRVMNEFKKLGADLAEVEFDQWEETAEALKEEKPHFRFRTWSGKATPQFPNPRVNHVWGGLVEYTPGEEDDAVVDESGDGDDGGDDKATAAPFDPEGDDLNETAVAADEGNREAQKKLTKLAKEAGFDADSFATWAEVAEKLQSEGEDDEAEEVDEDQESEEVDYNSLGEQADGGDEEAITQLEEAAKEAGLDPDDYPDSWTSLAEALSGEGESEEEEAEEEEDEYVPGKGDVVFYVNHKTKKKVECNVESVSEDNGTCVLKSLSDGKTKFVGIGFGELIVE